MDDLSKVGSKLYRPIATLKGGTVAMNKDSNGDASEREDFDREGRQAAGFASSIVPTLEEKTIFERRPDATHANGKPLFDVIEEGDGENGSGPKEAEVPGDAKKHNTIVDENLEASKTGVPAVQGSPGDKEMYGAPANANTNDDEVPNENTDRNNSTDPSDQEKQAIEARKVLRKHLTVKAGMNAWSMPTPTPKINPNRFHDPLDERFWKDMWVAVAVHNTEIYRKVFRCIVSSVI
jgi:phospholipase D1/2